MIVFYLIILKIQILVMLHLFNGHVILIRCYTKGVVVHNGENGNNANY